MQPLDHLALDGVPGGRSARRRHLQEYLHMNLRSRVLLLAAVDGGFRTFHGIRLEGRRGILHHR